MTTVTFERIIHPRRPTTPGIRAALGTGAAVIAASIRASRELDAVVSPSAQRHVVERFASRL